MSLQFDQPWILALGLIVVPLVVLSWRCLAAMDRLRRTVVVALRTVVLLTLVVMLAGPRTVREHDNMTVIGVLDLSGSVKRFARLPDVPDMDHPSNVEYVRQWFRQATRSRGPDDRFGLIVFDGEATVISVPVRGAYVDDNLDVSIADGTNIADAIRLALAIFPADTARRIILVSDGNQTAGDAEDAARQAAAGFLGDAGAAAARAGVPIDVAPITYEVTGDVQVVRVESPPTAQPGQTVTVRVVLDSTGPTTGRLHLRHEGRLVDLNGAAPGTARPILVPAGRSVQLAQVVLGETPINRFEATFEADDPAADVLLVNNRGDSFTATPGRGTVLVLDTRGNASANLVASALRQADIPVTVDRPQALGEDLLSLQRYDLIILDNIAAFELNPVQQALLGRYVHDLGGGMIMIGGEHGFGAGGWNGTPVEAILPLELDPPRELKLAGAALVLVLDQSGSMNRRVAGTRTTQQVIANEAAALAIESLRRESLIGVISFDFFAHVQVPLQRNDDPARITERVRAITSDGGTNLEPALRAAHRMLRGIEAKKKLVVCLSDGQSHVTDLDDLVNAMVADGIRITTIAVGDDADHETLKRIATLGGGKFYPVRNPRTLPRVLVDSVQVINKPLLKETPFVPVVLATGSTLTAGLDNAPPLGGLVITATRPEPTVTLEMTDPDGEPLLAHWQVGLGRVAAFTSDAGGGWSREWVQWPGYGTFWAQLARMIARPPADPDAELVSIVKDGRLFMTLDASREEGFLDYLHVDGTVYTPDGQSVPVRLRQTAPGRYEASIRASVPGNYVVALSPRRGTRQLAPVIGGASQSSSAEFRKFRSNEQLLERIAAITGGRVLDLTQPTAVELFDRTGMAPSRTALPAWRTLLWLAIALVLIDVAARRLAWDALLVRRSVRRATARVEPHEVRGREAAATLATLRQASAQVVQPRPIQTMAPGEQPTVPTHAVYTPPAPVPHSPPLPERTGPDPARVAAALDALAGKTPPPKPAQDEPTDPAPTTEEPTPGETTSNLLAAKRRARRKLDGETNV